MYEQAVARIGRYDGVIHRFPPKEQSGGRGVHTFSVIYHESESAYYGFAGPVQTGPIDLWKADSLHDWQRTRSPVWTQTGVRWPTAWRENDKTYVVYQQENSKAVRGLNKILGAANITNPWLKNGVTTLQLSTFDGDSITSNRLLIDGRSTGMSVHANPNFFRDRNQVGLVYYCGDGDEWQLRCRTADSIPGLTDSTDVILRTSDSLLAAPAIIRHPKTDRYLLFAEALHQESGQWITTLYESESLDEGFERSDEEILFEDNQACAFPYLHDDEDVLDLFISRCVEDTSGNVIDAAWEGQIHRFQL